MNRQPLTSTMNVSPRLFIVDDKFIERAGMKRIILQAFNSAFIEEVDSLSTGFDSILNSAFDLVLVDLPISRQETEEVLDLITRLRALKRDLPILAMSSGSNKYWFLRALNAGASGCFDKAERTKSLVKAVDLLLKGRRYISPTFVKMIPLWDRKQEKQPLHARLSQREYQVMLGIASGEMLTEIGGKLDITNKTVSTYKYRIYEKMNITNNAELFQYAYAYDII